MKTWFHFAASLACCLTAIWIVWSGRRRGRPGAYVWLTITLLSLVLWTGNVGWYIGPHGHSAQPLWLPAVGLTAGAFLIWTMTVTRVGWRASPAVVAVWVGEPLAVLLANLVLGNDVVVTIEQRRVIFGPLFAVHSLYCFCLLMVTVVVLSSRRHDREPRVRASANIVMAGGLSVIVVEALRLQSTDLVVAGVVVGIAALNATERGALHPVRPAGELIDDLGALVFLFDRRDRLVDMNGPARLFYSMRAVPAPELGASAVDVLGRDLTGVEGSPISLHVGEATTRFSGYSQRMPSTGSSPGGWLVLLRRTHRLEPQPFGTGFDPGVDLQRRMERLLMGAVPVQVLSEDGFRNVVAQVAGRAREASVVAGVLLLTDADVDAGVTVDARFEEAMAELDLVGRPHEYATGWFGTNAMGFIITAEAGQLSIAEFAEVLHLVAHPSDHKAGRGSGSESGRTRGVGVVQGPGSRAEQLLQSAAEQIDGWVARTG